ncbi:MAG: HEPN domain-containing protein [Nitrospirae bacterium]|nr:HEPN domain-containing protein [Nitrospirota bacterium]
MAAFDVKKTVQYWLESAAYDLETGRSLIDSGKFPYALFFGHLTLEKTLKGLIVEMSGEHAPHTHSLTLLVSKIADEVPASLIDQLAEYTEFHLEARYPDEKRNFYKKCTKEFSHRKFREMEEVYQWLIRKSKISF